MALWNAGGQDVQIGKILLSVQFTSMLPWGQPEPPETTLTILKEVGASEFVDGTGLASDAAARARVANVYFIVELQLWK